MEEATPKPARTLQTEPKAKNRKKLIIVMGIMGLIIVSSLSFYFLRSKNPIPENIRKQVTFPVYYPNKLPAGYSLDKNLIRVENGIMFFSLDSKKNQKIIISEQTAPSNPPDFDTIQKAYSSFKKIDVIGGKAIFIISGETPTAILLTNTTLINISASKDTPEDVLVRLVQDLQSLPD